MHFPFRTTLLLLLGTAFALTAPAQAGNRTERHEELDGAPNATSARRRLVENAVRTTIAPHIGYYTFDVRVGPGDFDVVRVHRVVKERRPHKPVKTKDGVFLVHGASLGFEQIFLPSLSSPVPEPDRSFALYLARQDLDVWGIDLGWTLVPIETTSFEFMNGWGVDKDTLHTDVALAFAQQTRRRTGQGRGTLHLLGFSYGAAIAYAQAGAETQLPPGLRKVKGIIPVDYALKQPDEPLRAAACAYAAGIQGLIDAGLFQSDQGIQLATLATLAKTAPDEPSPVVPGVTNFQAIILLTAATHLLGAPSPEPFWHFFGGEFDESGFPLDLRFTESDFMLDFVTTIPPYIPNQAFLDIYDATCEEIDVGFDDNLGEIEVPILYVGAGGGSGTFGEYTAKQTLSPDVTSVVVQLEPEDGRFQDFGHADLFLARDAEELAWRPIRDWILDRSGR